MNNYSLSIETTRLLRLYQWYMETLHPKRHVTYDVRTAPTTNWPVKMPYATNATDVLFSFPSSSTAGPLR